jgi:hypothetical protein
MEFYRRRDELVVVDGVGNPNDVLRRLITAIETSRSATS